jgi:hypothetical protein
VRLALLGAFGERLPVLPQPLDLELAVVGVVDRKLGEAGVGLGLEERGDERVGVLVQPVQADGLLLGDAGVVRLADRQRAAKVAVRLVPRRAARVVVTAPTISAAEGRNRAPWASSARSAAIACDGSNGSSRAR